MAETTPVTYATVQDIEARMLRDLTTDEEAVAGALLQDAAVLIDAAAPQASGATQGSQSALGYSQSWTIGSGGGAGELYLSKADRQILGAGNSIGSYSPVQELVPTPIPEVPA